MATQQPEVVIRAADGTEHVFPPGFDPKRAAAIVRERHAMGKPARPRVGATGSFDEPGFLRDLAGGVGAGVASTVFHGGDLIRRGLGMQRVIDTPEVRAGITPPSSVAGQAGFLAEQIGEFYVPLARLARLTRGSTLVRRAAVEAAGGAGVATVQSGGDPDQIATAAAVSGALPVAGAVFGATRRAAGRTAAGAREGGIGGAVASAVRTVAPQAPETMLTQALKPSATQTHFGDALTRAMPELKATEQVLKRPIQSLDDLLAAVKMAKQRVRAQYNEVAGPARAIGSMVDLTPVAEAMVRSIPKKLALEDPARALQMMQRAQQYRGRFSLEAAEQLLKETNAELGAFYNKFPFAQRRALSADPEAARLVAQAKALRESIYRTLDAEGQGAAAREVNRRYGALLEVEETATRRYNVARRQQPESLAEQLSKARAIGDMARGAWRVAHGDITGAADIASGQAMRKASEFMKEQQTTDALIRRAFAAFRGQPAPVLMSSHRPIRGALTSGSIITPPPADSSFVRGIRAQPAQSTRKALPAPQVRPMGPGADPSGVRSAPAKSVVQRDPRTGRMRRVYLSEKK